LLSILIILNEATATIEHRRDTTATLGRVEVYWSDGPGGDAVILVSSRVLKEAPAEKTRTKDMNFDCFARRV
jgi:hypothetical protein